MQESARELTAYCGLYCGDCNRFRSRSSDLARDLLTELQNTHFDKYAEVKSSSVDQADSKEVFKNYEKCREVLEAIVNLQCNSPCRVGGGCSSFSCKVLECCMANGLEGCWECDRFENCDNLHFLESMHHITPVENLKTIKKYGIDSWTDHRREFYIWE